MILCEKCFKKYKKVFLSDREFINENRSHLDYQKEYFQKNKKKIMVKRQENKIKKEKKQLTPNEIEKRKQKKRDYQKVYYKKRRALKEKIKTQIMKELEKMSQNTKEIKNNKEGEIFNDNDVIKTTSNKKYISKKEKQQIDIDYQIERKKHLEEITKDVSNTLVFD